MKTTIYLNWVLGRGLLLLPLLLAAAYSSAQDLTLYEHSVAVADDSEQTLVSARRDAMEAVLLKVSGERGVTANAALSDALGHAQDYVARYGFRRAERGAAQLYLWAAFDAAAINGLLASAGLSEWRGARPDSLVWLIVQGPGGPVIEGSEGDSTVIQALRGRAEERGLKAVVPLLDLQDQRALSVSDLWGNSPDAIRSASARYRVGVILVGRMEQTSAGQWSGQWTVYQGGESRNWRNSAATPEALAVAAMDWHADSLTAVYSGGGARMVGGATGGSMLLRVGGLGAFSDYLRVSRYLQGLSPVAGVQPIRLSGDLGEFDLRLAGSREGLQRLLSLEGMLAPVAAGAGGGAEYRLVR